MDKPTNLGVIVFLGVLVMCLCTLLFVMMLEFAKQDGQRKHERSENQKAALLLREQREKMEKLLEALQRSEKGNE